MHILIIDGPPTPYAAPNVNRRRCFNPRGKEKARAISQLQAQWRKSPLHGPIAVHYTFHMPIPKKLSKGDRSLLINDQLYHIKRPDADNLAKFANDALKEVAIQDDSQIFRLICEKVYSVAPRTVIKIIPV